MPDYTNRDYASILADMRAQIPVLAPRWTNQNEGDLGIALIQLLAGTLDLMSFYLDRQADETYLSSAVTREAVQRICSLIDYQLRRPTAATTTLRFSLESPAVSDITIPAKTVCSTANGQRWVTKSAATLFTGQTFVDVVAFQGELVRQTLTGTGSTVQTYTLSQTNVAQNFLEVVTGAQTWVEDRYDQTSQSPNRFQVQTSTDGTAALRFSTFLGEIPSQNQSIEVTYLRTDGERGNIGIDIVDSVVTSITGGSGLSVSNVTQGTGGRERESLAEAKLNAPRQLRLLQRVVTLQDYEDSALLYANVVQAQAINHSGYVEMYLALDDLERLFVERPAITSLTPTGSGSSLLTDTYFVGVTVTDEFGETTTISLNPPDGAVIDNETSVAVTAGQQIDVLFNKPDGALTAKVYLGTVSGELYFNIEQDISADAVGAPITISVVDDVNTSNAPPPARNTTGVRSPEGDSSLLNEIEDFIEARRALVAEFAIFNATVVPVNVDCTVTILDNFSQKNVSDAVTAALTDFFDIDNRAFGEDVRISELYAAVMDVQGVRFVEFTTPATSTVVVNDGEIASLGTLSVTALGGVV